ncbi:MAG: helix-turn-helix transcriptional regulator [Candidatus Desantisbacteria bacterium]
MIRLSQFIGTKVRQRRIELGLTQEKLAEKAEMDYRSIEAIERGERNLTLKSLEKIVGALGIPAGQFLPLNPEEGKSQLEETFLKLIALLSQRDKKTIKLFEGILTDIIKWMEEKG